MSLKLDRVLGRHDKKRLGQGIGAAVDSDLTLLHALQQARLGPRDCAVDLVGEEHVGHDGSRLKGELARLLVVDVEPGDVGRQEVRRKLDALERRTDTSRQGLGDQRFPQAGEVLQQHVAVGQESHQQEFDGGLFAHNDAGDVLHDPFARVERHDGISQDPL